MRASDRNCLQSCQVCAHSERAVAVHENAIKFLHASECQAHRLLLLLLRRVQFLGAVLFRKQIAIVTELMPLGDLHSALSGQKIVWGPR